ncbi:MAG: urease accessory protein UreD [Cyanobacteria bacterium]|nr:urease accessory protein UreD [Cyanobacteriota bacterium]
MTHQSVAAAGVDVERRAPDWNGDPDNGEGALAADNPADRRPPAMEGGETRGEASSETRGEACGESRALASAEANSEPSCGASGDASSDASNEASAQASNDVSSDARNKPSAKASSEASAEANAAAAALPASDLAPSAGSGSWHGRASLRFSRGGDGLSRHQGSASTPLKIQRGFNRANGRCELPLLHTAGGLVGGDQLSITVHLEPGSRALLTSVAAQKVYGTIGRSRLRPEGAWALQELAFQLEEGADLEWLPQELVVYANGLYEQRTRVNLAPGAGWLGAELVRLGRTAAGESLGAGRWRSLLEIRRRDPGGDRWELVDRLELGGSSLVEAHGLAGEPVFGSLVWAAPRKLAGAELVELVEACRGDRSGLEGTMACGSLEQGLLARYRGPSSTAARSWFTRLWARIRAAQGLAAPELPRVWPFQERPFAGQEAAGAAGQAWSLADRR